MPRRVRPGAATRGGGLALVDEEDLLGHIGQVGEDAAHKVGRVDVELEQAERRLLQHVPGGPKEERPQFWGGPRRAAGA